MPTTPPSQIHAVLEYLQQHLAAYPFDIEIDQPFVEELFDDFPELDVLEEIKAFRWYYNDAPLVAVKKPRLSIRRWVANARRRD